MVILGIDPGYATVGCGVAEYSLNRFTLLGYGAIETKPHTPFNERLEKIYDQTAELIERFKPDAVSMEKLYFNSNQKTAIDVSQARGVTVLAVQKHRIPLFEYTPLQVKQSVVGYGRADKHQVQEMVKLLLRLDTVPHHALLDLQRRILK